MGLKGIYVRHATSGEGRITDVDANKITVKYNNRNTVVYTTPNCFYTSLQPVNAKAKQAINDFLKVIQGGMTGTQSSTVHSTVRSFYNRYSAAISAEISYIKSNDGKIRDLYEGKLISEQRGEYIYLFESDGELNYPPGTEVKILPLKQGQNEIDGTLLDCNGSDILLCVQQDIGQAVSHIQFTEKSWKLLQFLQERLVQTLQTPTQLVCDLINDGSKNIQYNKNIIVGQDNAVRMSLSQPITFIWGPPGTGKTQTLARIAIKHMEVGHRVLMLSHSNVAVDGAIMRVYKLNPDGAPGKLVRYGYPKDKELVDHPYLTSSKLAMQSSGDYKTKYAALKKELKTVSRTSARYVQVRDELNRINADLKIREAEYVTNAKFVATTISMAVASKVIYKQLFDVVIFDEASMAYIPQVVYSASLAKSAFICMGDYCQLPPIVQNKKDDALNSDIFSYCDIVRAVEHNYSHNWLCLLDCQYRMHSDIADFISEGMYRGLIKTAAGVDEDRERIVRTEPRPQKAVSLVDLSGMMSCALKTKNDSHFNVLSAFLSFSLALQGAKNHSVGVITPYAAQAQLFRAMAVDVIKMNPELKPIICATVHQFQGSEQDIIIYDAVDCYRQKYPGALLTSTNHNTANRLFNVAMTRARGKFIGVANIDFLKRTGFSDTFLFKNMINQFEDQAMTGEKLTRTRHNIANAGLDIYEEGVGDQAYLEDLRSAKREIRIDIPKELYNSTVLADIEIAVSEAKKRNVKVYIRAEDKNSLPASIRNQTIKNSHAIDPITLVDKKIIWFGEPASRANFETQAGTIATQYRPVVRFVGLRAAQCLFSILNMADTIDDGTDRPGGSDGKADNFAVYVSQNCTCQKCGKPMRLRKNYKKGTFFLSCSGYPSCQSTQEITTQLVDDYFHTCGEYGKRCDKCTFETYLSVKNGRYGIYIECGSGFHKYKLDQI